MKVEGSTLAQVALHLDIAFVKHHDLFAETKPDAAAAFACAEKGYENFIQQFRGDAGSIISHFQGDPTLGGSRRR